MLGVTTYMTTDIAAVPLLWVLPLATYLLTFVLVFARKPPISLASIAPALPLVLPVWMCTPMQFGSMTWILIPLHLLLFFVVAMVCHGRLARSRPGPRHLTEFYLWISVGGVLGGLFNAVLAPLIFSRVIEYPLMLVLACLLRPRLTPTTDVPRDRRLDVLLPLAMGLITCGIVRAGQALDVLDNAAIRLLVFFVPAVICFIFRKRPLRFGLGFGAFLIATSYFADLQTGTTLHVERNFFGVKRIQIDAQGAFRELVHGGTKHGIQSTDPARSREPLAYFHRTGPIGDVFEALRGRDTDAPVAVIGLGIGTMAAYAEPGQRFTFYEIDPAVARLASNPEYFTYLTECRGEYEIVLGDGRQTLARAPDRSYGLIILDAFSSDAIPIHLLSREAIRLYLSKLDSDGFLAFHVSSRYLDLTPVLGNLAAEANLICLVRTDLKVSLQEREAGKFPSCYVVMSRQSEPVASLIDDPNWEAVEGDPSSALWTDQYCNVLSVFRWR
jgi:hypothetical protein